MQTGGAVQGVNTIPHSRWLDALRTLAFVALVAGAMVLLVWAVPPATSGVGADDAPKAGVVSTVVHEDAGNVRSGAGSAVVHDDAGGVHAGLATGYAPVHDDAGNVRSGAGSAAVANGGHPETYYPLPNGKLVSLNAGSAVIHDDAGDVHSGTGSTIVHDDAGSVNR